MSIDHTSLLMLSAKGHWVTCPINFQQYFFSSLPIEPHKVYNSPLYLVSYQSAAKSPNVTRVKTWKLRTTKIVFGLCEI